MTHTDPKDNQILKLQKENEKLKRQLTKFGKDKYGLFWFDVPEGFEDDVENKLPILEEVPKLAIKNKDDEPTHILIEGDNYHALTCLNYTHKGKIDVIYIDPPYNTGSDGFKYKDKRILDKYPDGTEVPVGHPLRHSYWLSFIYKRLGLAKGLLSHKGVLLCSIGEEELANAILILNQLFNYVSEPIVWLSKSVLNQNKVSKTSAICHEYILIASDYEVESKREVLDLTKNFEYLSQEEKNKIKNYPLSIILKKELSLYKINNVGRKKIILIPLSDYLIEKSYNKKSYNGHRFQKRTAQEGHGSQKYINLYKKITPSKEHLGVILDVKDKNNLGVKFVLDNSYFQSISNFPKVKMPSFLGFYQGGYAGYSTAKPLSLLERIIDKYSKDDSIILDFFAGSGTSLEAVNNLNKKDNGKRQIILVDNNENDTIPKILMKRIKKIL